MKIVGAKIIEMSHQKDQRGSFIKTFASEGEHSIPEFKVAEVFYSKTISGYARGMHLQVDQSASNRIISCIEGNIFDILLDLRPSSSTYLQTETLTMTPSHSGSIYVPAGVAHGFIAIENSTTHYLSDKGYNPDLDFGVNIYSLGIDWPLEKIVLSERDTNLPTLQTWLSTKQ